MSKRKTVYRDGSAYRAVEDQIRAAGAKGVSREDLIAKNPVSDVGVVISPTESSDRGDCRGNFSAQGHKYFVRRLKNKNLVWGWRKVELPIKKRKTADVVKQVKSKSKSKSKSKAKAKKSTKTTTMAHKTATA